MGRRPVELNMPQVMSERLAGATLQDLATKYGVGVSTIFHKIANFVPPRIGFTTPVIKVNDEYQPGVCAPAGNQPAPIMGSIDPCPTKPEDIFTSDHQFNELYWQYRDAIGFTMEPKPGEQQEQDSSGQELTVIASDLHVPYSHEAAIKWMVKRTFRKAKRLVIGGDLADMFYFSKYMKFKQHFSPMEELMQVQAALVMFSEAFEDVWVLRGNHDDRYIKWMKRMGMPVEVMEVFEYLYGQHAMHPIYVLARGLSNVHVVEPLNKDYASFSYLYQVGDCVISHAEKFSRTPNKTVGDVIQSLKSYHEAVGVIKPFRVVVQAHTHQAGKTWNDFGVVGIENGCLAQTPDYTGGAKNLPHRAPVLGFTELWQKDGRSDLERTNFIPFQQG